MAKGSKGMPDSNPKPEDINPKSDIAKPAAPLEKSGGLLSLYAKLPSPKETLQFRAKKLSEIMHNCDVILDTNTLLVPYDLEHTSFTEILRLLTQLADEKRLCIPGHVVREFLNRRPQSLSDISASFAKKRDGNLSISIKCPLLDGSDNFEKLKEVVNKIEDMLKDYREAIALVLGDIAEMGWNDPVSDRYSELIAKPGVFLELDENERRLIEREYQSRVRLGIPPGQQDSKKENNAEGDLIIWLTILARAKATNRDVIFVTNEGKNDWWHRSNNQGLYPRIELIEEFRRVTNGRSFQMLSLSQLLRSFRVNATAVDEVKAAEIQTELVFKRKRRHRSPNVRTLIEWFAQNFEDPVHSCPYESAEGGYQWIWGGPCDAEEELRERFPKASEYTIKAAVEQIEEDGVQEWSPKPDESAADDD